MVATKAALSIRVDALTDADGKSEPTAPTIGVENRAKLESRLRALEHQGDLAGIRSFSTPGKKQQKFEMNGETKTYNTSADAVDLVSTQRDPVEKALQAVKDVKDEKKKAKEERRAKRRAEKAGNETMEVDGDVKEEKDESISKKEKKRRRDEEDSPEEDVVSSPAKNGKVEETEEERKARKKARKLEKKKAEEAAKLSSSPEKANGDLHKKKRKKVEA